MPGMPSAYGLEWRGRGGDPQRYEKELARIFKNKPAKCLMCQFQVGNESGEFCQHPTGTQVLQSVTGPRPDWCPINGEPDAQ